MRIAARREAKKIPPFDLYRQQPVPGDFIERDMNAQYILNKCRLSTLGIPSMTTGDGNCLFNAVSIALTGSEDRAAELRLRTSVEMALNADSYTCHPDYDLLMTHSPSFNTSMQDCCTEGAYSSIWTIMALSSVVGLPIKSVYPPMNGPQCKAHQALSKTFATEDNAHLEPVNVLWSRMGPWRPPNWTGNHFVPVLKQKEQPPRTETTYEKRQQTINTPIVETKSQLIATPGNKRFQPSEISTPKNSFLIRDILGNDIRITPMTTKAHTAEEPSENSTNNVDPEITPMTTKSHTAEEPSENSTNNVYSETCLDDTSTINENVGLQSSSTSINTNHNSSVDSELYDSTISEKSKTLPVPENVKPLPQGRWHKAEDIYKLLKEKTYLHSDVPPGNKSDCFMLVENGRNAERVKQNKKCEFFDDCGVWATQKGNTVKSYYHLVNENLAYCELKKEELCVRKRNNGKTSWVPLDPQPRPENVVVLSRYYATLKADPTFQKRVTFVYKAAKESLSNVALYEYQGIQPNQNKFRRTNPKTVDKIKEKVLKFDKIPREIFADIKREDSLNCARDFAVVKNIKYEEKRKEKQSRSNRVNIADEILDVLGMVNDHPFVQTIIHNKDQVPNIILYTEEQILDLKHFIKNAKNQQIGIDRTFNLGNYYVTTLVYKNQRIIRKPTQSTEELEEHPIFLGPVMLHKDATYKTYKAFLEHVKTELESEVGAVELRLSQNMEFGTDDEKALTKAIDHVFPSATRLLCTKHLKDNVKHYLQNNVGMEKSLRENVMSKIFGEDGITDANCTIDFESRSEDLKVSMHKDFPRFENYFEKNLKDRLKQYVFEPCRDDSVKRNWTNNNAESINNILKLAVDWKPRGARELIEKIYTVTELHFLDYRSALHNDGNYRLTKAESQYLVSDSLWRCKSKAERNDLFINFLKDSKKRKRKYIESSDGKFTVVAKAQTKATKASQRKRPRNERASSKR